jgi:putative DNA primase/helicase
MLDDGMSIDYRTMLKGYDQASGEMMHAHLLKLGLAQNTDTTNAQRLLKKYGTDIRYNPEWKKWIVWNGRYWRTDIGGAYVHEKGLIMVRSMYDDLIKMSDWQGKLDLLKHAVQSESMRRRQAFIEAASLEPSLNITSDDLDTNPWLLNVENGTVDLESGEFHEHRQADMITKIARVSYDPQADCPVWKQFIREIMNFNAGMTGFLQTAAGWALTGDTSEQVMFILFGSGANGKSTFLNTVMHILGDYATVTQTETFMKQSGDRISNDIARLRGTRFVTTTEAEQGRRLSEPLIKQITGNDKMTARFLYGEYFNFLPTFKIFMATNHKPVIKGTDYGIWRRIRLIPFTKTITPEKQDKDLQSKLLAEGPGILNWLLEGVRRWKTERLQTPPDISSATDEYREEMDAIGNFIRERCVQSPGASIKARELFRAYQEWCGENNAPRKQRTVFRSTVKRVAY